MKWMKQGHTSFNSSNWWSGSTHKRRRLFLLMLPVLLPGLIISGIAIASISQQKKAKVLSLAENYQSQLQQLMHDLTGRIEMSIDDAFQQLISQPVSWEHNESPQKDLKDVLLKNPVVKYPFIIDDRGEYVFPPSNETGKSMVPAQAPPTPSKPVASLFKEAEGLELKERKFQKALMVYNRSLKSVRPTDAFRPYIHNAVARCYFKLGRYTQALSYYKDITASEEPVSLVFPAMRQKAVCYRQLGQEQKTAQAYLRLYEKILQYESGSESGSQKEDFTFFKNEALEYLNRHIPATPSSQERFQRAKSMDRVQDLTLLDISLRWRYFDDEGAAANTGGQFLDFQDKRRFARIRQFYLAGDEKTQFYKTVKRMKRWTAGIPENSGSGYAQIRVLNRRVEIVFRPLPQTQTSSGRYYFGFMVSPEPLSQWPLAPLLSGLPNGVSLEIRKPGDSQFLFPLATQSLDRYLQGKTIGLYARNRNHIANRVEQETRLNYFLVTLLILALILGVFLFYKYLAREAQLVRLKSEFTDGASHTLKTPLTRIRMLAEKLYLGWVTRESKKQEYLRHILDETDRMSEMITNMLDFSRIEAGRKQYRFVTSSIYDVVKQVTGDYQDYAGHLGFQLETSLQEDIPPFPIDTDAITLIMVNLLQNAVKYSGDTRHITVRLSLDCENTIVVLEVEDKGMGMQEKELKKIFQRFYRTGDPRIRTIEGSGLGLFLVRHAVHAHHGEISVSSQPGKGSCFRVSMPLDVQHLDKAEKQ